MAVHSAGSRSGRDPRPEVRSVERRVYVRAVPRDVWTTLHDPTAAAGLLPELTLDPAGPSWPAAGSVRSGEIRLGLLRTAVRVESLEARPQSTFEIAITAAGFAIGWRWQMEPLAGGTRVIHEGSFETTDRWTGVLIRIGRESIGSVAEAHLRNLKTRAESAAQAETGPAA